MDKFRQLSIREFVVSSLSKGDRSLGMDQTKQTYDWEWTKRNRPMFGYWPDQTDRRLGMDQTKQTNVWVLARPNIPNSGMSQTEQIQIRYGPDGAARPKICPDYELGRTGPPCPRPRSVWPVLLGSRTSSCESTEKVYHTNLNSSLRVIATLVEDSVVKKLEI